MLTYLVNSTIMNNVQYRRRDDLNKTVTSREAILAASQKLVMEKGLQLWKMFGEKFSICPKVLFSF